MRTVVVTHRIRESNVEPLTPSELTHLLQERLIAIGANWRGRPERDWANNEKAREEFGIFDQLAAEGSLVIANYEGLEPNRRIVGRIVPTATRRPEQWAGLRVLRLLLTQQINAKEAGVADLQVPPGRTIDDITGKAGNRVLRLLSSSIL